LRFGGKMSDCIFCKIVNGEILTKIIYEDDDIIAFEDIAPVAPKHILIIPKEHYATMEDVKDKGIFSHIFSKIPQIASDNGLDDYRIVINKGEKAGQTVFHLHVHIIGGRDLQWPPG
jgi:histidine triad (HIT) family protein